MLGRKRARTGDQVLADFAAKLSELRIRAGEPSFAQLESLTHQSPWPQRRSTIHDKLAGKSAPSEEFVKAFVEACRLFAQERHIWLSDEDRNPRIWAQRCTEVRTEIAKARQARQKAVKQEPAVDTARRPIADWDPVQLGVHRPIQVPRPSWLQEMPEYIERGHDRLLRACLTKYPGKPKMITLVGGACTGKTRSAYEAISRCRPDWRLVAPGTPDELAETLIGDTVDTECVIWIDEAQNYLKEAAAMALRNLLCRGHGDVIVIATLWPAHWNALCAPAEIGAEDSRFQARRVLEHAIRIDVPEGFDRMEVARAEGLARTDPLLAAVVRDCGPRGQITQALAAGPGLVHSYDNASPFAKAVLTAAMDARRLGYTGLLPDDFLHAAAAGYLDEERRAEAADDWFRRALHDCTKKVKGVVAPLTPVRISPGIGEADGYRFADFLDQRGREILRERAVPALVWDALDLVAAPADRAALAREAARRGLLQNAYLLAKPIAVDVDDTTAIGIVAAQYRRWGLIEQAVHWWQRAAAQGDSHAMCHLAQCSEENNDQTAANEWWRSGAEQGNPYAIWQYADRLDRLGLPHDAEDVLRRAARAGEPYALEELMKRLERQQRFDEAEELYRDIVRRGHLPSARSSPGLMQLTGMLSKVGRRLRTEDTAALKRAAADGHCAAMSDLAELLEHEGQTEEAATWWARATEKGCPRAIRHMAETCLSAGDTEQAEEWLLALSDSDDTQAMWHLADLWERGGRRREAEELLRRAIAYGDRHALRRLSESLLKADRKADAESVMRAALENGHGGSLGELANFVEACRGNEEAQRLRIYGIEPGGATADPWGPSADLSLFTGIAGASGGHHSYVLMS
jgi:pentatricopeptide repeat protein